MYDTLWQGNSDLCTRTTELVMVSVSLDHVLLLVGFRYLCQRESLTVRLISDSWLLENQFSI